MSAAARRAACRPQTRSIPAEPVTNQLEVLTGRELLYTSRLDARRNKKDDANETSRAVTNNLTQGSPHHNRQTVVHK
jgi:hypothetical protein